MPLDSGLESQGGRGYVDPDQIYKNAVTKLRALLSATEVANQSEDMADVDGPPFGGSLDHLNHIGSMEPRPGLTDPQFSKRRKFVKHSNSKVKRALFQKNNSSERERHSSWHNLEHLDVNNQEISLIKRQEAYIAQLETETRFCRDQLTEVLQHVRSVLSEKEAEKQSDVVKNAISEVFSTIQGWQHNIQPNASALVEHLRQENAQLKQASLGHGSSDVLVQKLNKDIDVLTEALKQMRAEAEDVRQHENEAVEQVQRSIQAAEQLKMEKTELEYEIEQLKLQVERQQTRIRALIEEQVVKIDEEREIVEKRAQDQVRMVREELRGQVEEVGRLSAEVETFQRHEMDLKRQMEEKESLAESVRQDLEKRLGHTQLELVALGSSRQQLEQDRANLKMDLDHTKHALTTEQSRNEAELVSLRGRLTKTEEILLVCRQESLELTEAKASLERELNLIRLQIEGSDHSRQSDLASAKNDLNIELTKTLKERELAYKMNERKLEDMISRQREVIGQLKHQCNLITDKCEESVKDYEAQLAKLRASQADLKAKNEALNQARAGLESQLLERGRLHEKLCQRLEHLDMQRTHMDENLRRSMIRYESQLQEKRAVIHENEFLKDILRSKGFLPELSKKKDKNHLSSISKDISDAKLTSKVKVKKAKPPKRLLNHAVVIERNGQVTSPLLKP
ncbi:serologically defined colon cancer antigen 8 homolog [Tigriopus californicus]|nr:serologically defined colon cancer antigen 8 homolog [Tigriopus californicus]|eukprot:TCALIF_07682-PA protein Name:"Similar to Sdccag8 Serologically defined colon cancer antigen 8 homolog (Mus musculus)" AED:0.18 eAED:0.18 QI:0/-1/0/1/-1/1/1/0/682